jgi:hypothetical protein
MQPLQTIIDQAAEAFGLDPLKCQLKHKKDTLDPSQPFRFSGVPNNAVIEIVVQDRNVVSSSANVKIGLSGDGVESTTSVFR